MTDTTKPTTEPTQTNQPTEPTEPVDWEAKYKDAIAHSREWEKRAKDNKTAADELAALKEAQLSETEKLTRRAEKAEKALADIKAREQTTAWRTTAAAKYNVPADMLTATSETDIDAQAKALADWKAELTKPAAPKVSKPDGTPSNNADNPNRAILKALFGNN